MWAIVESPASRMRAPSASAGARATVNRRTKSRGMIIMNSTGMDDDNLQDQAVVLFISTWWAEARKQLYTLSLSGSEELKYGSTGSRSILPEGD